VTEPVKESEPVSSHAPVSQQPDPAPMTGERAVPREPAPVVEEDPNRPKRTGWWQRAKASLGG